MNEQQQIEARRRRIVEKMLAMRSMRKGTVNEQWFPVVRGGKKTDELRGPYFVITYKVGNRTVSERLKSEAQVVRARAQTDDYRHFRALCTELEELTVQLGELGPQEQGDGERLKKGLKSR
mgnify:CR=1 FL=1